MYHYSEHYHHSDRHYHQNDHHSDHLVTYKGRRVCTQQGECTLASAAGSCSSAEASSSSSVSSLLSSLTTSSLPLTPCHHEHGSHNHHCHCLKIIINSVKMCNWKSVLDPSTTATKCARILAPSFATEFYQRVQEWFHPWTIIVLNKTCVTRCSVIINLWGTNVSFGLPNDLTEIRRFPHLTFIIFSSGGIIFSFLGGRTYLRTEASHLKVCGLEFGEELSW